MWKRIVLERFVPFEWKCIDSKKSENSALIPFTIFFIYSSILFGDFETMQYDCGILRLKWYYDFCSSFKHMANELVRRSRRTSKADG